MEEFLQYIQIRYDDNKEQLNAAGELLEYLYFAYIKPPFKTVLSSEEYRIAQDLLMLMSALNTNKLDESKLRTDFVKSLLSEYGISWPLTAVDKQTIKNNILETYRYYITAAFIADIVNRSDKKENWRWFITGLLTLVAAAASYGWLFK